MPTLQDSTYKHRTVHYYDEDSKTRLCGQPAKRHTTNSYNVTCLDCLSIMRERAIPLQWDTHFLLDRARSLQHAGEHLYHRPEAQTPEQDVLPFTATFQAAPLLTAFALELALKAFICSERPGPPPPIHDLLLLYEALHSDTQTYLNIRFLSLPPHLADPSFHLNRPDLYFSPRPIKEPIKTILEPHRNLFHHWRYPSLEHLPFRTDITNLNHVLTFLIETFHQGWPARKSSFDFPPE